MALKRSTVGRFNANGTVVDVRNIEVQQGANIATQQHSGLVEITNALISSAVQSRISFDTSLSTALSTFGLGMTEYAAVDDVEAVLGNLIGASIDSANTHTKYAKEATALASAYIESFNVAEGAEATATVVVFFHSSDGDTQPMEEDTNVAFPALSSIPEIHTIGPFTLNATAVPGVTGYSYQSGITLNFQATDGKVYTTGAFPTSFDRRIGITSSDPLSISALTDIIGVEITGTTTVVLYRSDNDIPSATGAITLTIANGYTQNQTSSGQHGDQFTGGAEIVPVSADGTTIPIAVS